MVSVEKNLNKFLNVVFVLLILFAFNFVKSNAEINNGELMLRGKIFYGNASWYGGRFHGRKTSNGEKYNKNRLTAAHRSLPFNTLVKVTNLRNKKSVVVRINDRGPFKSGRIIDLSEKAAKKIDSRDPGIAYVKLQVLEPTKSLLRKVSGRRFLFRRKS